MLSSMYEAHLETKMFYEHSQGLKLSQLEPQYQ